MESEKPKYKVGDIVVYDGEVTKVLEVFTDGNNDLVGYELDLPSRINKSDRVFVMHHNFDRLSSMESVAFCANPNKEPIDYYFKGFEPEAFEILDGGELRAIEGKLRHIQPNQNLSFPSSLAGDLSDPLNMHNYWAVELNDEIVGLKLKDSVLFRPSREQIRNSKLEMVRRK
jgi:hypothetical protein